MSVKSKSQLLSDISTRLPDNTSGLITPSDVRDNMSNMVDSLLGISETAVAAVTASHALSSTAPGFPYSGSAGINGNIRFSDSGSQAFMYYSDSFPLISVYRGSSGRNIDHLYIFNNSHFNPSLLTSSYGIVAIGSGAARSASFYGRHTAIGVSSLKSMTGVSEGNTAIGIWSGEYFISGSSNVYLGYSAGTNHRSGSSNIIIGGTAVHNLADDNNIDWGRALHNCIGIGSNVFRYNSSTPTTLTNTTAIGTLIETDLSNVLLLGGSDANGYGQNIIIGRTTYDSGYKFQVNGNSEFSGSISQGSGVTASGAYNYASGINTTASGNYSRAEGNGSEASGQSCHAQGGATSVIVFGLPQTFRGPKAIGHMTHAEGGATFAYGTGSHAEGVSTTASGYFSHAEGLRTIASANYTHAEGYYTTASSGVAHSEGAYTWANGFGSHTEGVGTFAASFAGYSHVEGSGSTTYADIAHAEGFYTTASGLSAHSEGAYTIASGTFSHAEGISTWAIGTGSHAEGYFTVASGSYQHVGGQYNALNNTSSLFVVGGGTATVRKDIFDARVDVNLSGSIKVPDNLNNPTNPVVGSMYFNPSTNLLYIYNGTAWRSASFS